MLCQIGNGIGQSWVRAADPGDGLHLWSGIVFRAALVYHRAIGGDLRYPLLC